VGVQLNTKVQTSGNLINTVREFSV